MLFAALLVVAVASPPTALYLGVDDLNPVCVAAGDLHAKTLHLDPKADSREAVNLAKDPAYADRVKDLFALLHAGPSAALPPR